MTATNMKRDGMRNNMDTEKLDAESTKNIIGVDNGCPVCGGIVRGNDEFRYVCLHCKLSFKAEELNSPEVRDQLAFKKELDDLNARWEEFRKKLRAKSEEVRLTVQEYDREIKETDTGDMAKKDPGYMEADDRKMDSAHDKAGIQAEGQDDIEKEDIEKQSIENDDTEKGNPEGSTDEEDIESILSAPPIPPAGPDLDAISRLFK
ncbi:hypothetical protein JW968_04800 [Candidatus Woesearchaeota archaeon]|nr:hypothetical protein [Candidatus Woesearchaeota archaeon]